MGDRPDIVPLPVRRASRNDASRWSRLRGRLKLWVGGLLRGRGGPGLVQPVMLDDAVTGWTFQVHVGGLSTTISVGDRDYTFDRLTGRFLGSGYANRSSCCIPDRTRQ